MKWVNEYGNLFSLIGLGLTLLTFFGVLWNKRILNRINKKNFKLNRMPENLNDLKVISENVSILITDFNQKKKEIKKELSKIQPILKSLNKSLENKELDNLRSLKISVTNIDHWSYDGQQLSWLKKILTKQILMTEILVREVDIKLTRLITDIENIGRDNNKNIL